MYVQGAGLLLLVLQQLPLQNFCFSHRRCLCPWSHSGSAHFLQLLLALQTLTAFRRTQQKKICVFLSLHSWPSSSEAQRGEKTSGRYLWCMKPQMGETVVWDHFPSGFPWQVFVHGTKHCGKADSCWSQALHPSFSTLTLIQGLELLEAGRVSLPNTEEVVLQ